MIEDEDGGPYVGQHAWEEATHEGPYLGWVPTEDLDDIVLVKRLGAATAATSVVTPGP